MKISSCLFMLLLAAAPTPGQEPDQAGPQSSGREGFRDRQARYRLQAGDVIEVTYPYSPEYNHVVTVQPDGWVSLPMANDVRLGGLTVEQAGAAIALRAGERLQQPAVAVTLKEFVKPFFTVAGEVQHPGRYDLHGPVSAVEAIAMSGGFKESSQRSQVILLRQAQDNQAEVKLIDLKRIMRAAYLHEDISLLSGDLLVVPQNKIGRLEPIVRLGSTGLYGLGLALGGL